MQPNHYQAIKTGEGDITFEVTDGKLDIEPQTITIKTPFLTRLFQRRIFIVNPDTAAVILWEKIFYTVTGDIPPMEYAYHTGSNSHIFKNIDYVFQRFPDSINVPGDKNIPKTRICLALSGEMHPFIQMQDIQGKSGMETAIEVAKKRFLYEPENADYYLQYLLTVMEEKPFLELVTDRLDHRPILLECHRMYQSAKEKYDPDYDLEPEYRRLLESDPDNPMLQYLLGRIVIDQNEAVELFKKSINGKNPVKRGFVALTLHYLNTAQFEEAINTSERMVELFPRDTENRYMYYESLVGAGKYDKLIQEYQQNLKKDPYDVHSLLSMTTTMIDQGKVKDAEDAIGSWFMKYEKNIRPSEKMEIKAFFDMNKAYHTGDLEEWSRILEKDPSPAKQFALAVTRGNMEEAKTYLEKYEKKDIHDYLLLYIAMKQANQENDAQQYLKRVCEILRKEYREERLVADCLEGIQTPDPAYICSLSFMPREKLYILIAMGMTYPEQREMYFALARKLNYQKDCPHLFFKSILDKDSPHGAPQ